MTSSVKTASREMTLKEVAGLMRDGDMGAMPVVENGKLIGIVTDRDIVVRAIAEGKDHRTPIEGLYLCGAATHPAGSVIALNGRNAAMAVIEDAGAA